MVLRAGLFWARGTASPHILHCAPLDIWKTSVQLAKSNRRVAFLTLEERGDFCVYDELLFAPLHAIGWHAEEIPWSRPGVPWASFDAVVIRSTWDYQDRPNAFLATLEQIDRVTRLFNPLSVCQWNLQKTYLRDLEQRGVSIVPTLWPERLDRQTLQAAFDAHRVDCLIAKPVIGANADDTYVLPKSDPDRWGSALRVFAQTPLMLQPFLHAVIEEGEFSLFFFAGKYSHSIRKRPAPGDFRVQEEHGGVIRCEEPPADVRELAERTLASIPADLLYARVDVIRGEEGQPLLMELELIEPSLYFDQCAEAASSFVRAFQDLVESAPSRRASAHSGLP